MLIKGFATVALAGCLVLTAAAAPAASETRPLLTQAQATTDDALKDKIDFRLETSNLVRKYDVKVKVVKGVATLSGDVATAAQKAEAARLAKVNGVTKVEN